MRMISWYAETTLLRTWTQIEGDFRLLRRQNGSMQLLILAGQKLLHGVGGVVVGGFQLLNGSFEDTLELAGFSGLRERLQRLQSGNGTNRGNGVRHLFSSLTATNRWNAESCL